MLVLPQIKYKNVETLKLNKKHVIVRITIYTKNKQSKAQNLEVNELTKKSTF